MKLTGAQIIMETLVEQGVDSVFGYPGGTVTNIYDELYKNRHRITHYITCHEQHAAHAADGYARVTGKAGVVIATLRPRGNQHSYRYCKRVFGFFAHRCNHRKCCDHASWP